MSDQQEIVAELLFDVPCIWSGRMKDISDCSRIARTEIATINVALCVPAA